jgi:HAMP domain-containing protein
MHPCSSSDDVANSSQEDSHADFQMSSTTFGVKRINPDGIGMINDIPTGIETSDEIGEIAIAIERMRTSLDSVNIRLNRS